MKHLFSFLFIFSFAYAIQSNIYLRKSESTDLYLESYGFYRCTIYAESNDHLQFSKKIKVIEKDSIETLEYGLSYRILNTNASFVLWSQEKSLKLDILINGEKLSSLHITENLSPLFNEYYISEIFNTEKNFGSAINTIPEFIEVSKTKKIQNTILGNNLFLEIFNRPLSDFYIPEERQSVVLAMNEGFQDSIVEQSLAPLVNELKLVLLDEDHRYIDHADIRSSHLKKRQVPLKLNNVYSNTTHYYFISLERNWDSIDKPWRQSVDILSYCLFITENQQFLEIPFYGSPGMVNPDLQANHSYSLTSDPVPKIACLNKTRCQLPLSQLYPWAIYITDKDGTLIFRKTSKVFLSADGVSIPTAAFKQTSSPFYRVIAKQNHESKKFIIY